MAAGDQDNLFELFSLFANASNRMHAAGDIAAVMRIAATTALQMTHSGAATAGLRLNDQLAFSEYCLGRSWSPLQCRYGAEVGWVDTVIKQKTPLLVSKADKGRCFADQHVTALTNARQMLVIPVIDKANDLLACLLLFDKTRGAFDAQDIAVVEKLASMMSVAIDNCIQLSESRRIEADLEKSVATYRTLVEQIPAITYIATLDRSRILFISPQVESMLGYCQNDFLANQQTWVQRIHPDDRERVLSEAARSMREHIPFHCEYRICAKDGKHIWVNDTAATVRDHDQDIYLQGVVHDISERKLSEKKLLHMAHFDQLTGLANRSLFHDRLDQTLAAARRHKLRFAVLFLDLDGFKAVNDKLGHQAGDLLLAETARRLTTNVREVDTVARMGGDEFTIILNDVHCRDNIRQVTEKIITAVSAPYAHIGLEHRVTLSMGVALYPDDSKERDGLIIAADNAMYRAKNEGKNRCCFHQTEADNV